jgi:galactose mutarotase-like enzyme
MIYSLENEHISIQIKQLGAELCSYFDKETKREVIWQADPKFWKRHAPILFPIIGKVQNNKYKLGKDSFELSQHGFARDQNYKLVKQSEYSLTLETSNTLKTKSVFPFDFKLEIEFSIKEKVLKVITRVKNPSQKNIFFLYWGSPWLQLSI